MAVGSAMTIINKALEFAAGLTLIWLIAAYCGVV